MVGQLYLLLYLFQAKLFPEYNTRRPVVLGKSANRSEISILLSNK